MYRDVAPLLTGILLALLLLAVEHFLLWQSKIHLVVRYALGLGAVGAGLTVVALLAGHMTIIDFWAVTGCSGLLVGLLHYWRHRTGQRPSDIEDAFHAGELAQRAREGTPHAVSRESGARDN